jgi:hypothetical protein
MTKYYPAKQAGPAVHCPDAPAQPTFLLFFYYYYSQYCYCYYH